MSFISGIVLFLISSKALNHSLYFSSMSGLVGIDSTIDSVATQGDLSFGLRFLNIIYI